jgi:hypothetical protein
MNIQDATKLGVAQLLMLGEPFTWTQGEDALKANEGGGWRVMMVYLVRERWVKKCAGGWRVSDAGKEALL